MAEDQRLARLDKIFEVNSTKNMEDKSVNGSNCRKSALLSRMLLRHKIALKNSKPIKLIDLLQQYLGMFKEVATLIFDIAIYLTDVSSEEASLLVE